MALSEARWPLRVWRERFHFARFHFLAYGALGLLAATAYEQLGAAALVAFALPPILLALSMREGLARESATS
jgi:drug/metabolite transporter (DMT)-like permease